MWRMTIPNMPETLTYSMAAVIVIEGLLALLLAVRGDWLGVVLVLALAANLYWFVCRQLVAVITARFAVGTCAIVLFVAALADLLATHPYSGLLFLLAAIVLGFVLVMLQQGGAPAEFRIGRLVAIGAPSRTALLRMLEELRDVGLLTEDEFTAKRALLAL